jgi:hypothetical protein
VKEKDKGKGKARTQEKEDKEYEEEMDDGFDRWIAEIPEDVLVKSLEYASNHADSQQSHDKLLIERELCSGSRIDLNPNIPDVVKYLDIPFVKNFEEEVFRCRAGPRICTGKGSKVFLGSFEMASKEQNKTWRGKLWTLSESCHPKQAEGCLFRLPVAFKPMGFLEYEFEAVFQARVMHAHAPLEDTEGRVKYSKLYNVCSPEESDIVGVPARWCRSVWLDIVKLAEIARRDLLCQEYNFSREVSLAEDAFDTDPERKSDVYCRVLIPAVHPSLLEKIMSISAIKKYFFSFEIDYIFDNWFPTLECIIALPPKAIVIMFNVLSREGHPTIKRLYFPALYLRPKISFKKIMDARDAQKHKSTSARAASSSASEGGPLDFFYDTEDESIADLFTWKSRTHTWPFPLLSPDSYDSVRDFVFRNCEDAYDDVAETEVSFLNMMVQQLADGDTCADYKLFCLGAGRVEKESSARQAILWSLEDTMHSLNKVSVQTPRRSRRGDGSDQGSPTRCRIVLIKSDFHSRALMALGAFRKIMDRHAMDSFSADTSEGADLLLVDQIHWYPKRHPCADPDFSIPADITPSSEQYRSLRLIQHLPVIFIDGSAGTGKTLAMRMILQSFHYDASLFIATTASAVQEVGSRVVCKRSMTAHRFLIIHSMYCSWREDEHQRRSVEGFAAGKSTHMHGEWKKKMESSAETKHRSCRRYYCEPLDLYYDKCPIEGLKIVVIDETSMLGVKEFCRIFYALACCHNGKPPKIVFAGDGGQLASISAGQLHSSLGRAIEPWTIKFKVEHRFGGVANNLIKKNASAIRTGRNPMFDAITQIGRLGAYEHSFGSQVGSQVSYHFIEIRNVTWSQNMEEISEAVTPALDFLLTQKEYFKGLSRTGETNAIQIMCRTNPLRHMVGDYMTRKVFRPLIAEKWMTTERTSPYADLYKRSKIIYKRNIYEKEIQLFHNLLYVVVAIQDVFLYVESDDSSNKSLSQRVDEMLKETLHDDVVAESSRDARSLKSGVMVSSAKQAMMDEYMHYSLGKIVPKYEDLPCTHAKSLGERVMQRKIGRRLLVVPASDVNAQGVVLSRERQRMIPWTLKHKPFIERATALTICGVQGREFDTAIYIQPFFFDKADVRELLYVAATRARKRVVMIAPRDILQQTIQNPGRQRTTYIGDFLRTELQQKMQHEAFLPPPVDDAFLELERNELSVKETLLERIEKAEAESPTRLFKLMKSYSLRKKKDIISSTTSQSFLSRRRNAAQSETSDVKDRPPQSESRVQALIRRRTEIAAREEEEEREIERKRKDIPLSSSTVPDVTVDTRPECAKKQRR